MHAMPEYKTRMQHDLESARHHMVLRLSGFAMRESVKISIIFDGHGSQRRAGISRSSIKIIFSKSTENADTVIKRLVDTPSKQEERIVVTSDREIIRFARQCAVHTLSSRQFAESLIQTSRKTRPVEMKYEQELSSKDVETWMDLFQNQKPEFEDGADHAD